MLPILSPLHTDHYQLVMAYSYWQLQKHEQEAVFHLTYRTHPFHGDYTICCGLERVIRYLSQYRFSETDIDYLRQMPAAPGKKLFCEEFLQYLQNLTLSCDVDAIPEGTLTFPQEPLLRIKGPLLQCQLLETPLLNFMGFSSLVATQAARICQAAAGDPVIEFGLRRTQGPDGGLSASRAAFVGGCSGTSNLLAGQIYGIPTKGTQAHSWVMAFPSELESFQAFTQVIQHDIVLVVDTYNTLEGVQHALETARKLRQQGKDILAVRLDSGDRLTLSKQVRHLLDEAGFPQIKIFVSGDVDEAMIRDLKNQNAPIDVWGVGTRLSTAWQQPALDVVYKLSALSTTDGAWNYKIKSSTDDPAKTTNPGIQQVRRYLRQNQLIRDVIYDVETGIKPGLEKDSDHAIDLLEPIFRKGKLVYEQPVLTAIRDHCLRQVKDWHAYPQPGYHATLEPRLEKIKQKLYHQRP